MPSKTFDNLAISKKERIISALRKEFSEHSLEEATVKNIVTYLHIARGSFYQYFSSLQEAYFYLIEQNLMNIHFVFYHLLKQNNFQIITSLTLFEPLLIKEIYYSENRNLYQQYYLSLNPKLAQAWNKYQKKDLNASTFLLKQNEKMNYVRIIIHYLIQKVFVENLSEEDFKKYYQQYLKWLKEGIDNASVGSGL